MARASSRQAKVSIEKMSKNEARVGELFNKIYGNLGEPTENNPHFVEGNGRHNPK